MPPLWLARNVKGSASHSQIAAVRIVIFQVIFVLVRIQVTRVRVDGFEQAVHRAKRDVAHIRLFHVFALDAREDFRVDLKVLVNAVIG